MKSHTYPVSVYHKDFEADKATEASLKLHSKIVHSDEEFEALGDDWGFHPSHKLEKVEPKIEEVVVDGHKEVKKQLKKVK